MLWQLVFTHMLTSGGMLASAGATQGSCAMSTSPDISSISTMLSALGMQIVTGSPEELRDVAAQCRHRAAGLRRPPASPEQISDEARERELRRADDYDAAAVVCELVASRMSSAA